MTLRCLEGWFLVSSFAFKLRAIFANWIDLVTCDDKGLLLVCKPFRLFPRGRIMETLDPVEALRLIRKLALVAAGSNELGYLKTTMRDVLVIIDRALPTARRDQLRGH